MRITKKIDRAFQWAGEKMGAEAKTTHSEEFKMLETEMSLRQDGELRRMDSFVACSEQLQVWRSSRSP